MKKQLLFISVLTMIGVSANAQQCLSSGFCSNFTNQYPTTTFSTTSSTWTTVSAYMNAGNWTLFNVTSGNTYEWSYCEAYGGTSTAWDTQLTLINNSTNANICFSDNTCGTNGNAPYISWVATYTGVVKLLTSQANCASNTGSPYTKLVWRMANGVQTTAILGLDVSHYEGTITWSQVKSAPKVFSWCKATEGTNNTDATFVTNMTNGASAGVVMGGYHFAHPETNSASSEASYFLSKAASYIKPCSLPPVLDLEDPSGGPSLTSSMSSSALTTWVQAWMSAVQTQTGITPILYTNGSIATYLGSSIKSTYKLWMAAPDGSSTTPPSNIGGWSNWAFKQYSFTGTCSGISGQVDLDVFNGDMTAFNTLIGCTTSVLPVANFTAATTNCPGQSVSLTDNSTNTPTSWSWTMTSGTPAASILQSPSVTYTTAGTYTVTLVSTNSAGSSTVVSHTVTVNASPAVPTITLAGDTLTSSSTTGNQWFLNGVLISGATNQTYVATSNGAYTVVVTNSFGCSSTSAATTYTNNNPPVANFTASTTDCIGQSITLTDNSSNTPTSWSWTMTNGTPATSSSQNPTVNYSTAGTYTVTLIATNSGGASSPVSQTITVNASPAVPTINLSGNTLTSSATTGNQWYFNGVLISGATSQTYTATSSGSYTVVVTKSFGCSTTSTSTTYSNGNPPVANFTASTGDCEGQTITLTDNSSNTPTSWSWTMPSGTPATSNLQSPSVTYSTAGTYTVTLTATNSSGASTPTSNTITINANPAIPTITIAGITLTSSALTGNQWYLNGVLINGATNQSYAATVNGNYTVVVINSFGCSNTSAATIYTIAGISSIADNALLNVFPNPSNGIVNINFAGRSKHINIVVMNDLGQQIYSEMINDCQNDCNKIIDMSSFKKGIYLFRIMTDENIYTKQILFVA